MGPNGRSTGSAAEALLPEPSNQKTSRLHARPGSDASTRNDTKPHFEPAALPFCFIHIARTAGGSLGAAISERYGKARLFVKTRTTDFGEIAAQVRPGTRIIYGHMNYGLHEAMPVRYATILRDPISRVISHYRLHEEQRRRRGRQPFSFRLFLEKQEARNLQSAILAGIWRVESVGISPSEMLARAKTHLRSFDIVGFFDDLDDFAARLDLSVPRAAVHQFKSSFAPTDDDILEVVDRNKIDILLYNWAKEKFSQEPP